MLIKPFILCTFLVNFAFGSESYMSSIYHCSESNPQSHVDIDQLMGMWYGIEIINHKSEAKHDITVEEGCPVLYFSEDRTPTTYRPIYGDYNYQNSYGSGYGRGYNNPNLNVFGKNEEDMYTSQYTTQNPIYSSEYQQYHNNPMQNQDHSNQDYSNYNNRHYPNTNVNVNDPRRLRYHEQIKRMRLLWDEKGVHTEYSIRYNVTKPGVWITSGPQNGSALEPKFNSFAGTMQVLKAVGNHMVLSFCLQMPDQQLFTVLLSRVQNFSQYEIHGVHSMLQRYGYTTNSIRRVCTYSGAINIGEINYFYLFIMAACTFFVRRF